MTPSKVIGVRVSASQYLEILREAEKKGCVVSRVLLEAWQASREQMQLEATIAASEARIVERVSAHVSAEFKRYTGG